MLSETTQRRIVAIVEEYDRKGEQIANLRKVRRELRRALKQHEAGKLELPDYERVRKQHNANAHELNDASRGHRDAFQQVFQIIRDAKAGRMLFQ